MKLKVDIEFYKKAYLSGKTPWPSDVPEKPFYDFLIKIKSVAQNFSPLRILDIGCGEGRHIILSKEIFPDSKVFGFDIIKEPILTAKKRIIERKNSFLCIADAFFIPFKNSSFDIVIDFGVFHHIRKKDVKKYKSEVLRVLKPGGFFLIGVFSEKYKHYPEENRKRDFIYHRKHYDRFFTEDRLKKEFEELKLIELREEGRGLEWFIYGLFQR